MNRKYALALAVGGASLVTGVVGARVFMGDDVAAVPDEVRHETPDGSNYAISGPYSHKNLSVYLVHGRDVAGGATPITLEEAFKRKLVVVHETEEVSELEIENVSKTEEIYVQAGDIVKGGKQDRVLAVDLVVPARSGRVPIASFCVEQGRWQRRGSENAAAFESSSDMVASKELKVAAKLSNSQSAVWREVASQQGSLSNATNSNVASNTSRSSLQLSLEHPAVKSNADDYVRLLAKANDGKTDVIGFVFAINGEINSGDLYGQGALFTKMWPRLIRSAAIEAVSSSHIKAKSNKFTLPQIADFLSSVEKVSLTDTRAVTDRVTMTTREGKDSVLVETIDKPRDGWLHRNYISTT